MKIAFPLVYPYHQYGLGRGTYLDDISAAIRLAPQHSKGCYFNLASTITVLT